MTRDPERLLSPASGADALERALLAGLRDERAPEHVRRGAWQGIAAGIAALGPAGAAAAAASGATGLAASATSSLAGAAKGGAAAALIGKWLLLGAVGAGAAAGAVWVATRSPEPAPAGRSPIAAPAAVMPAPQPATQPSAAVPSTEVPVPRAVKRPRGDSLAAESALLQTARAELRAGALREAERALSSLERRYPRGALGQERELLRIELARAHGDAAGAQRLAASFLQRYPQSPHAARVSQLMASE